MQHSIKQSARPCWDVTLFSVRHLMSEMGQSRRFWPVRAMSAYPPIATNERTLLDVSNVPTTDIIPPVEAAEASASAADYETGVNTRFMDQRELNFVTPRHVALPKQSLTS